MCLISCNKQPEIKSNLTSNELTLGSFQNLNEIEIEYYSMKKSGYETFTIEEQNELSEISKFFDLKKTEECLCKKSTSVTFKNREGKKSRSRDRTTQLQYYI